MSANNTENKHSVLKKTANDTKKSTLDDKNESKKRKTTDSIESSEKAMTPAEKLKARMKSQLNKISSNDQSIKKKDLNWHRTDLKRFTKEWSDDIAKHVDLREANKLMDEEDREYERERVQKGKISMKDVEHAEAIFGKMSDKDLKYLELETDKK